MEVWFKTRASLYTLASSCCFFFITQKKRAQSHSYSFTNLHTLTRSFNILFSTIHNVISTNRALLSSTLIHSVPKTKSLIKLQIKQNKRAKHKIKINNNVDTKMCIIANTFRKKRGTFYTFK